MATIGKPARPAVYQAELGGVALWRDGTKAVVSLCLGGLWIRILEAEAATMFHEKRSPAELEAIARGHFNRRRDYRQTRRDRIKAAPPIALREAAE